MYVIHYTEESPFDIFRLILGTLSYLQSTDIIQCKLRKYMVADSVFFVGGYVGNKKVLILQGTCSPGADYLADSIESIGQVI